MSRLCSDTPRVSQCPGANTQLWQPDVALINHSLLLVTFIPSPRIDQAQSCLKYTAQPKLQLPHPPPCPRSWQVWFLLCHQVSAQRSHDQRGLHWPASSSFPPSLFEHPSRCFKVYNKYLSGNILVSFFPYWFSFPTITWTAGKQNLGTFWVPFLKNNVQPTVGVP